MRSFGENETNRSYSVSSPPRFLYCLGRPLGYFSAISPFGDRIRITARLTYTARGSDYSSACETRLEPITITFGATVFSDTLSLIVFAICVPIYQSGFSVSGLVVQLIEIAVFVPIILFGLSRLGAHFLKKVEDDEDAYFVLMLAIVAVAGLLAQSINLPGIVGAFLAGLAVNAAVHDKPAKAKLEFFGNSFFIPIFFIVTGFLIDPFAFFQSITTNFPLVSAVVVALVVGKWVAAQTVGRAFAILRPRA